MAVSPPVTCDSRVTIYGDSVLDRSGHHGWHRTGSGHRRSWRHRVEDCESVHEGELDDQDEEV